MEKMMTRIRDLMAIPSVKIVLFAVLALLVAGIAKGFVQRLLRGKGKISDPRRASLSRIGTLTFWLVLLLFLPSLFRQVGWERLAEPLAQWTGSLPALLPRLLAAGFVLLLGDFLACLLSDLILSCLSESSCKSSLSRLFGNSADPLARGAALLVKTVVFLFAAAQGLELLGLSLLTEIAGGIVMAIPLLLKAGAVLLGASLLLSRISSGGENPVLAGMARLLVCLLAGFMILDQLSIAPNIVDTAFLILLVGGTLTFVLSFGLGGKDFARKMLEDWEKKLKEKKSDPKDPKNQDPPNP